MKKSIPLFALLLWGVATLAQITSPCPGLKNPASFTSGSTAGVYVGYYSGETGTKPSSNYAPNAMTGCTGVNMSGTIIPAS